MSDLTKERIEDWRKWGIPQLLPAGILEFHSLCDMALRSLAPSATGAPVAWMYTEDGERMFGHPDGYRPKDAVPLYAAPVEVTAMPYANLGDILMQYVDRLSDPVDTDPLEKIVAELLAALDGRDMKGEQP